MEAVRALKRRLSDVVYRQMVNDAKNGETGPEHGRFKIVDLVTDTRVRA
jgi:hypothetical protein